MYRLNQSTIKRTEDPFICPKRFKVYDLDRELEGETSKAMILGQYFEWKATGTLPKEGNVPVIPKLKNGSDPVVKERIDAQAALFNKKLEEKGWRIVSCGMTVCIRTEIEGEEVELYGTYDQLIESVKHPGSRSIMDTKMVGNIHSDFGDFCWGDMDRYDKLQAKMYHLIWKELTGQDVPFIYAIFDNKPDAEHKFWPYRTTEEDHQEVKRRAVAAISRLRQWEEEGYPEQPLYSECKKCQVDCDMRVTGEVAPVQSVQLGTQNQQPNGRPDMAAGELVNI